MSIQKQYEYNENYQKENIQRVVVKFNRKSERDQRLYEFLKKQPSMQEFIKKAIEKMM